MLLIVAAAALLVSCGNKGNKFGDDEYPVQTVTTQNAALQSTYPATIKGVQDVEIRPKVSGFITHINVKEGQTVHAGQVLFVIDNVTYQAQVRQAQAAVNTSSAQLRTANLTYQNSKKLFANKVIGSYELESAQNTYESARAQLAQTQASLASAKENLSYCYVKSPANGVIGTLPFKVGALVSSSNSEPLTTVSNISTMEIYFSMTEKDILDMTKTSGGMAGVISSYPAVQLQLSDGTIYTHEGKVTKMSGVIDQSTGSVQMIARFINPDHLLKSGGSGAIVVPKNNSAAIVIPQNCAMEVQDKLFVYVLGSNNKVKYTQITVDPQNDGKTYIVTSGLKVGDKYVTNGLTKLTDGMAIKPISPEQYEKKIKDAEKLGSIQGDYGKMKEAFK